MLRELAPNMIRPAFLAQRETLAGFAAVARPKGMTVIPVEVDVPEQFEQAFAKVQREGADGLLAASGPPFLPFAARVAAFALERRLPASFGHRESVDAGGLMMYGPNLPALFRQMTRLVDHILKGAKASDLPTEQPTTFDLILNAKTAKILGLTMPPTLLALADEVIE